MNEWYQSLGGLWRHSWDVMTGAGDHRGTGTRYATLATIGAQGPEARLVALRGADETSAVLSVHTDLYSVKTGELRADPRASLHIWRQSHDLQIRARGRMTISSGAAVADLWDDVPAPSRESYGVKPAPGTPIEAPGAYTRVPDFDSFATLVMEVSEFDVVHLSPDYHRRVCFARARDWQGQWLSP